MSYIDGFVIAVPTANKQKFIDHARQGDPRCGNEEDDRLDGETGHRGPPHEP